MVAAAEALPNVQPAPGSTPEAGVTVQVCDKLGPSGSVTDPAIETAVPSCPEYGPPALTTGGALMTTRTTSVAEAPSSSVRVSNTLCVPETVNGWLLAQVP